MHPTVPLQLPALAPARREIPQTPVSHLVAHSTSKSLKEHNSISSSETPQASAADRIARLELAVFGLKKKVERLEQRLQRTDYSIAALYQVSPIPKQSQTLPPGRPLVGTLISPATSSAPQETTCKFCTIL